MAQHNNLSLADASNYVGSTEVSKQVTMSKNIELMWRIRFDSPFWTVQVRNGQAGAEWQDVREPKPSVGYTASGKPICIFPIRSFETESAAFEYCESAFPRLREYIKPKPTFFQRLFRLNEE